MILGKLVWQAIGLALGLAIGLLAVTAFVLIFYPMPIQRVVDFFIERWILWLVLYGVIFLALLLDKKAER